MYNRAYLRLKGCPKCGGDILIDKALDDDAVCIQCGFRNYPKKAPPVPVRQRVKKVAIKADGPAKHSVKA